MESLFRRLKEKRQSLGLPDNMKVSDVHLPPRSSPTHTNPTDCPGRSAGDDPGPDGAGEDHAAEVSAVL